MEAEQNTSRSQYILFIIIAFLVPFVKVPWAINSLMVDKSLLFTLGILLTLFLWFMARIRDGVVVFPRSAILYSTGLIISSYLLSTIFSTNVGVSFTGALFDVETFWTVFLLVVTIFLSSVAFQTLSSVAVLYLALFSSGLILFLSELTHIIFGLGFGILVGPGSNLLGNWYDFGIFFGLMTLLALILIEFGQRLSFFRRLSFILIILSLLALVFVNFSLVWWVLAFFAGLIFVIKIFKKRFFDSTLVFPRFALFVLIISVLAIYAGKSGGVLDKFTSNLTPAPIEVRPSWGGTFEVGRASFLKDPILGVGPNLFVRRWVEAKPKEINSGPFWDADFNSGVGYIPTAWVTVGMLGFLSWIIFLVSIFIGAGKALRQYEDKNPNHVYALISSLGALYLWIMAVFYTPGLVVLFLASLLTGISVATFVFGTNLSNFVITTNISSKVKALTILLLTIFSIGVLSIGYLYVNKYRALAYYNESVDETNASNFDSAIILTEKASSIDSSDMYQRAIASAYTSLLIQKLQAPTNSKEQETLQEEFVKLFTAATSAIEKAIEIDKSNYVNWLMQGDIYANAVEFKLEGAYERSLSAYKEAGRLNPSNPFIFLQLARLESLNKNMGGAVDYLNKAIALKPNYTDAFLFASGIALEGGDLETAIRAAELAIESAPDDFSTFFQLGYLNYQNGDYDMAVETLEKALFLNPSFANARYFLGLSYERIGKKELAIKEFEKIITTNPDNEEVLRIIANLKAGHPAFSP